MTVGLGAGTQNLEQCRGSEGGVKAAESVKK